MKTSDCAAGSIGAPEIRRPSPSVRKRISRPDRLWIRSTSGASVNP